MDRYSTNFTRSGGYIFSRDAIVLIAKEMARFTESEAKINIALADNHNVQSSDVDEVLSDSYVLNRLIERIDITSMSESKIVDNKHVRNTRQASVTLSTNRYESIDVDIRGDRDASVSLRGEIETIIDGQKKWYWWLAGRIPSPFDAILFGAACMAFLVLSIMVVAPLFGKDATKDLLWLAGLLAVLAMWLSFSLRRKVFPKILFDIGKSGDLVQASGTWRNVILIVVALGFFVSVLASWFYDRIK
jgi:hypothetical protein